MTSRRIREHLGLEVVERRVLSSSMSPLIRRGDRIRFTRDHRRPLIGEIWVFERAEVHVVHRVLWVSGQRVLVKGDALPTTDGWIDLKQLFGPVEAIERAARWTPTNTRPDRLLGLGLSLGLWPYRWLRSRVGVHLHLVSPPGG